MSLRRKNLSKKLQRKKKQVEKERTRRKANRRKLNQYMSLNQLKNPSQLSNLSQLNRTKSKKANNSKTIIAIKIPMLLPLAILKIKRMVKRESNNKRKKVMLSLNYQNQSQRNPLMMKKDGLLLDRRRSRTQMFIKKKLRR
jgi:hypothetical protein